MKCQLLIFLLLVIFFNQSQAGFFDTLISPFTWIYKSTKSTQTNQTLDNLNNNLTHQLNNFNNSLTDNFNYKTRNEVNLTDSADFRSNSLTNLNVIDVSNQFEEIFFNNLSIPENVTDLIKLEGAKNGLITGEMENELVTDFLNLIETNSSDVSFLENFQDSFTTQFNPWLFFDLLKYGTNIKSNIEKEKEEKEENFPKPVYIPIKKDEDELKNETYHSVFLYHSDLAHQLNQYYRINP